MATQLRLGGVDIWLDEWALSPGDSIPGKVGVALDTVDAVLVCWSEHARTSAWVKSELETAIARRLEDGLRIIPVRLDDTPLLALLGPLYWVSVTDDDQTAVNKILGVDTTGFVQSVQPLLDEATIEAVSFHGAGVYVICPNCGAPPA
ncbi:TIR domain-containing protein [Streptomyces sp. NPDC010273]|uniref:toll/interleukin-1 receptor domain-containing protein n=1 Tax=Streptomyces sp. NPDC010273 TaxID=3364829 RepID=UPI0036E436C9